jgi:hypothetical protein
VNDDFVGPATISVDAKDPRLPVALPHWTHHPGVADSPASDQRADVADRSGNLMAKRQLIQHPRSSLAVDEVQIGVADAAEGNSQAHVVGTYV